MERLAGEWMIEVYFHLVGTDFYNAAHETVALFVLQGYHAADLDMLIVEFSFDEEHLLVEIDNALFHVFTVSSVGREREVKAVAFLQWGDGFLEVVEHHTATGEEHKGASLLGLLNECVVGRSCIVQFVGHCYHVLVMFHVVFLDVINMYDGAKVRKIFHNSANLYYYRDHSAS